MSKPEELAEPDKIYMLVEAIDHLVQARAKQQVSMFVENSTGAAYHAETAADAKGILRSILELALREAIELAKEDV